MSDRERSVAIAQAVRVLRQGLGPQLSDKVELQQLDQEMLEALNVLRIFAPAEYSRWTKLAADTFPAGDDEQPVTAETVEQVVETFAAQAPPVGETVSSPEQTGGGSILGGGFVPPDAPNAEDDRPLLGNTTRGEYRWEDQFAFQASNPSMIRHVQKNLEKAGLLEEGSFVPGFWDEPSADALAGAMGFANREQTVGKDTSWMDIVSRLQQFEKPKEKKEFLKFSAPPKLMPDPASINQSVKARFRQALGREPTDAELNQYARQLSGGFAAQQDQMVAEARRQFFDENFQETEAGATLQSALDATFKVLPFSGGAEAPTIGEGRAAPRIVETIDPVARFAETFDKRFGPEIRRNERVGDTSAARQNVMSSLLTMQGLVG